MTMKVLFIYLFIKSKTWINGEICCWKRQKINLEMHVD